MDDDLVSKAEVARLREHVRDLVEKHNTSVRVLNGHLEKHNLMVAALDKLTAVLETLIERIERLESADLRRMN